MPVNISKIGFGCSGLTSLNDRNASLALLEHAYAHGITHFDVARLYGMGQAESIVGEFAQNKRDKITITSKFGLNPPSLVIQNKRLFSIIKKIIKSIPFAQKAVKKQLHSKVQSVFTVANATVSLEKSLTELKTDYIDYYLLHEAKLVDAQNEELIDFLETKKREGKILNYGIGTAFSAINTDIEMFNKGCKVFQFNNDIFEDKISRFSGVADKLLITHSALQCLTRVQERISATIPVGEEVCIESLFDADLSDKQILAGLLLYNSAIRNPSGITLFSSTRKENITGNLNAIDQFVRKNIDIRSLNRLAQYVKNDN